MEAEYKSTSLFSDFYLWILFPSFPNNALLVFVSSNKIPIRYINIFGCKMTKSGQVEYFSKALCKLTLQGRKFKFKFKPSALFLLFRNTFSPFTLLVTPAAHPANKSPSWLQPSPLLQSSGPSLKCLLEAAWVWLCMRMIGNGAWGALVCTCVCQLQRLTCWGVYTLETGPFTHILISMSSVAVAEPWRWQDFGEHIALLLGITGHPFDNPTKQIIFKKTIIKPDWWLYVQMEWDEICIFIWK